MINNIFFFLLLKYFEKIENLNFIQLKSYNITLNDFCKKKFFFLFLNFKKKIENKLYILSILQNNISTHNLITASKYLKTGDLNLN
jgi:hypothetical protein